jgi:hypothetical protein
VLILGVKEKAMDHPDQKPKRSQPAQPSKGAPPKNGEREIEAEEIEMNRALREANRPIPGSLGGDLKP